MRGEWSGRWVADHFGVTLETTDAPVGATIPDLVGLALRRNPRRAHLLVSRVLGKHVPTDPRLVRGTGLLLGRLVAEHLGGAPAPDCSEVFRRALDAIDGPDAAAAAARFAAAVTPSTALPVRAALVIGFAETAVALGHSVADALPGSYYLHSTRRRTGVPPLAGFAEAHSHATEHLLCPTDPTILTGPGHGTIVLVDDELTTGTTAANTVAILDALHPGRRYVVATLADLRGLNDDALQRCAAQRGLRVDVVALARGRALFEDDLRARVADWLLTRSEPDTSAPDDDAWDAVVNVARRGVSEGGRHGISAAERSRVRPWLVEAARALAPRPGERLLVLGTEEFMAAPLQLACAWADWRPDATVLFSSTTRSPAVAVDLPGYALRTALSWTTHADGAPSGRHAYNVRPATGAPGWDRIVAVTDDPLPEAPQRSLLACLRGSAPRVEAVAVQPWDGVRR